MAISENINMLVITNICSDNVVKVNDNINRYCDIDEDRVLTVDDEFYVDFCIV
jgi:hypothetical protein